MMQLARGGDESEDVNMSKPSDESGSSDNGSSEFATDHSARSNEKQGKPNKPSELMRESSSKKPTAAPKDATANMRNQATINKYIHAQLSRKVEELVEVFNKEFTITRPYCNKVTVKVPKTELLQIETRK